MSDGPLVGSSPLEEMSCSMLCLIFQLLLYNSVNKDIQRAKKRDLTAWKLLQNYEIQIIVQTQHLYLKECNTGEWLVGVRLTNAIFYGISCFHVLRKLEFGG